MLLVGRYVSAEGEHGLVIGRVQRVDLQGRQRNDGPILLPHQGLLLFSGVWKDSINSLEILISPVCSPAAAGVTTECCAYGTVGPKMRPPFYVFQLLLLELVVIHRFRRHCEADERGHPRECLSGTRACMCGYSPGSVSGRQAGWMGTSMVFIMPVACLCRVGSCVITTAD